MIKKIVANANVEIFEFRVGRARVPGDSNLKTLTFNHQFFVIKQPGILFNSLFNECDYTASMLDSEESESLIVLERQTVEIDDFERFKIRGKKFDRQYCSIYVARLAALKDILVAKSKKKWGPPPIWQADRLSEYECDQGLVILIGTIYKHQELKPSILKELSEEIQVPYQVPRSNYCSDTDKLFLEDESLRTKLLGNHPKPEEIVTGLVCALLGRGTDDGSFWVEDWCFAGCCPRICTSLELSSCDRGKLLLVSGFDFANSADCLRLDLLSEWIGGQAGIPSAQKEVASVLQVIVAGNSVRSTVETYTHRLYRTKNSYPSAGALESVLATHRFDSYLETLVENCCVILMPGQFDPSDHSIPQQPLHPCTLPKSSRYKSCRGVTNPWIGKIGDRIVAGSSGQPIEDIMRVAGVEEATALDWLEKTLVWRHFAPTAPDTLPAYPYLSADPFVMQECPDIYFAGNMEEYATKLYTGEEGQSVRLISIPKFTKTGTAVIVDLASLNAWPISFGSS